MVLFDEFNDVVVGDDFFVVVVDNATEFDDLRILSCLVLESLYSINDLGSNSGAVFFRGH